MKFTPIANIADEHMIEIFVICTGDDPNLPITRNEVAVIAEDDTYSVMCMMDSGGIFFSHKTLGVQYVPPHAYGVLIREGYEVSGISEIPRNGTSS